MSERHQAAIKHLRRRDPILRRVIDVHGSCTLRPRRDRFAMLVRSILSQQVSTAAARTIVGRVTELVGTLSAEQILATRPARLRAAGVSPQKLGYLLDLCQATTDGRLNLRQIARQDDQSVVAQLVQVKGIGEWTAHMFLIFSLGRDDVLPTGDLGVRTAMRNLYQLDALPDVARACEIATAWRPYASVASWYCWRSLEQAAG